MPPTGTVSSTDHELAEAISGSVSDSDGRSYAASTTRSPSVLELLHPDGPERRVSVHGSGPEGALARLSPAPDAGAEVLLLAPARAERSDGAWLERAGAAAAALPEDGIVVATHPSRRLRRRLAMGGFEPTARMLHVPDVARSRHVFPVDGSAARFTLGRLIPLGPFKRAAARAVVLPGAWRIAPTTVVFRRPAAPALFTWLGGLTDSVSRWTAIVSPSWQPGGSAVVHRFGDGDLPDAVAKLGGGVAREARALEALGATARSAGADVPAVLRTGTHGGLPFLVETPLRGRPAVPRLNGSPRRATELVGGLARWLTAWNAATVSRRPVQPDDVERLVLEPARRLAPELPDADAYLDRLGQLGDACTGRPLAFVSAHNDLTASNVLVGADRLGIVDWEHAAAVCPPLGDLAYAIVDAAAAVRGYRDRLEAYATAFATDGAYGARAAELLRESAASLGVEGPALELCLQACWLHHADNERLKERRKTAGRGERPFLAILRRAGSEPIPS